MSSISAFASLSRMPSMLKKGLPSSSLSSSMTLHHPQRFFSRSCCRSPPLLLSSRRQQAKKATGLSTPPKCLFTVLPFTTCCSQCAGAGATINGQEVISIDQTTFKANNDNVGVVLRQIGQQQRKQEAFVSQKKQYHTTTKMPLSSVTDSLLSADGSLSLLLNRKVINYSKFNVNNNDDHVSRRCFNSSSSLCMMMSLSNDEINKRLNEFQDLFVEARMCIDDLKDSIGTVYYEDDEEETREVVEAAISCFESLIKDIDDIDEKNKVLRSNGLKVEQLKGELELTLHEHEDHH